MRIRSDSSSWRLPMQPVLAAFLLSTAMFPAGGCAAHRSQSEQRPPTYDPLAPKPIEPRDALERAALERGADLEVIDRLMDDRTTPPAFDRRPLATLPATAEIADGVPVLNDTNPFAEPTPLAPKEPSIRVGIARSTFRTRTREEVLSAVQPFIDLVQREVNVRGEPVLHEQAAELYYALLDGREQMTIAHVFDYLLVRSWFAGADDDNASVLLATARPANPYVGEADREFPGTPGTSVVLVVASDAPYSSFADLRGKRLALAANYTHAPGAFLTHLLRTADQPAGEPFFERVTLRRYTKDAVIDVIKGEADAACVDQGTIGALDRFYGLGSHVRAIATSPRYNVDVLFTSLNNVATHRTEIELTQTQLTTLGKDPEGEEVLFFFDTEGWSNYREGDIDAALRHFDDYLAFIDETPVDLKPLLDPHAPVDRRTYDILGDQ
ncbi:MAG: hypothetical protein D6744_04345 [Planctomycetota bacterium]|nr:MAG: hypothetical protein D6744_04345 [Planctomycetota bacterium]